MEATIENTIGALEVGSTITTFLFGVITLQLHTYFSLYKSDRAAYKGIAVSVWYVDPSSTQPAAMGLITPFRFFDLVQTTIIAVFVYRATIDNYGVAPGANVPYPELGAATIVGSFIAALVQVSFGYCPSLATSRSANTALMLRAVFLRLPHLALPSYSLALSQLLLLRHFSLSFWPGVLVWYPAHRRQQRAGILCKQL